MVDNAIVVLRSALQHTSDIPVIIIFVGVLLFSLSFLRVKLWLYFCIAIISVAVSFLPGYYMGPPLTRFLIGLHIISAEWNASEDISRSVGLGIIITLVLLIITIIMIITTLYEIFKKRDPLYVLITKKNPSTQDYLRVPQDRINKISTPDINSIDLPTKNLINNNFTDENLKMNAFKWVVLGLPEHRAIKKVFIDADMNNLN